MTPRPSPASSQTAFRRGAFAVTVVVALLVAALPAALPAAGAEGDPEPPATAPTAISLLAPATARADASVDVSAIATDETGAVLPGVPLTLQRQDPAGDGVWTDVAVAVTDEAGRAAYSIVVGRDPAENALRVRAEGADPISPVASLETRIALVRRLARLAVTGPESVVDERQVRLVWTLGTGAGLPIAGAPVSVRRWVDGRWAAWRTLTTGSLGRVVLRTRPRVDTRWRASTPAAAWHSRAVSGVHRVDNLPPGPVVDLPAAAPLPRVALPPQPRATEPGPAPRVTRIPDAVWQSMVGRSWHPGCPVGRASLRLIRINYWAYDGYRRRGELVVHARAAENVAGAFAAIYRARLPIRAMYRVDRFGYSPRLGGADDYRSMAAGNTSGFNCRTVVNYPAALSPHAYGYAIDINTWENPYASRSGIVPNTWWQYHSHPLVAWRSSSHPMVQLLSRHGWSWPYGIGDTQHFHAPASGRMARLLARAAAAEEAYE